MSKQEAIEKLKRAIGIVQEQAGYNLMEVVETALDVEVIWDDETDEIYVNA